MKNNGIHEPKPRIAGGPRSGWVRVLGGMGGRPHGNLSRAGYLSFLLRLVRLNVASLPPAFRRPKVASLLRAFRTGRFSKKRARSARSAFTPPGATAAAMPGASEASDGQAAGGR